MEPLGIAVRAAVQADVRGGVLLVVGCGSLGLFSIGAAKVLGAGRVLASDISEFRLDLAGRVGADVVIDGRQAALREAVSTATNGEMTDAAIDTSGNPSAIAQALASVSPGGRLLVLGLLDAPVALDLSSQVVLREITVQGLYGRLIDETWLQVERLLLARRLPLDAVLTQTFRLHDYGEAFRSAAGGDAGKVMLAP